MLTTSDMTLPVAPNTTFHCFMDLALELRIIIWNYADEPRLVEQEVQLRDTHDFVASRHTPAVLHVHHESRELFLKKYLDLANQASLNHVYFNPEIDILYFRDDELPSQRDCLTSYELVQSIPYKDRILSLAGNYRFYEGNVDGDYPESKCCGPLVLLFPSLKRFYKTHSSTYHQHCFVVDHYGLERVPSQALGGRQFYFGNTLKDKQTYFTAIGESNYDKVFNSGVSSRMVLDYQQSSPCDFKTCKEEWDTKLEEFSDRGEPWASMAWPQIEEFGDLLSYSHHIPDADISCWLKRIWRDGKLVEVSPEEMRTLCDQWN
ncbi:hypothetical protein HYFRA_00009191 [Hymenoscyphus fraxineus]|uniref:2EXR domain-containing protein n=1 Tax=Hymenoscyphus fraxineus TaxID=746836 RepID=A0A9N9KZ22_9HELO|nr:hypothetical protein HYFRA_00009191 [Hymenoscyphus fraxineus]